MCGYSMEGCSPGPMRGLGFQRNTEHRSLSQGLVVSIPGNPEFIVDTPRAKEILNSQSENLVCVRSWREYIGEVSGYNYIRKKGRIPGSCVCQLRNRCLSYG